MTVAPETVENLRSALAPLVASVDLVCEDVTVRSAGGRTVVTVVVDLPEDRTGSADLDTVAEASRLISDHLDADESFLDGAAYELEVTTPGAERTLTEPRHFRRARGRLARIRTAAGEDLVARVLAVSDDDVLTLRPEDAPGSKPRARRGGPAAPRELPIAEVASAKVLIEFTAPAELPDVDGDATHDDPTEEG